MNLNKNKLIITAALGIAAFSVIFFKITIPIPGTLIGIDFREIFIIFGAVFSNLPGVLLIALLADLARIVNDAFASYHVVSILVHLISATIFYFYYRKIVKPRSKLLYQILLWIGGIVFYYTVGLSFLFVGIFFIYDKAAIISMFGGDLNFWQIYLTLVKFSISEIIITMSLTTVFVFFIPKKYR